MRLSSARAGTWQDVSDPSQPHEAGLLRLAIDKARFELGWRPRWPVERAVAETVAWYRHHLEDLASLRDFSLGQIAEF